MKHNVTVASGLDWQSGIRHFPGGLLYFVGNGHVWAYGKDADLNVYARNANSIANLTRMHVTE